jgi:hypothetical protein
MNLGNLKTFVEAEYAKEIQQSAKRNSRSKGNLK